MFLFVAAYSFSCAQNTVSKDTLSVAPLNKNLKHHKPYTGSLSFFNHSISVPFHKIINPIIHPGMQAGIEGRYFETRRSKLFQALNLGMFYNKYNGTGFYLNTELAYRYTSKFRISAEALAGIGYLRIFHPADIYQLTDDGTYEKVKDKGFSSPVFSFGLGLGYSIKSASSFSFSPFFRYQSIIQTRYSADLEVLPHAAFHIGIRISKRRSK